MASTLLQCLKGSIKVESVLDTSRIAWYLQRMKKDDYDTEQANYEAHDPQARYRAWEVFVRNAILVQILETKPRNRRVEFYNKGVLRGFGIRKVSGNKKDQPNQDFHEARHSLAQRADDEYRRYCQRHPHRSERGGRRSLRVDPVFDDEGENLSLMPYREFFIRIDPSFFAIKRCAESMMDRQNGQKYTRELVYEAAPPLPPTPNHHGPGAFPPGPSRYNATPPLVPSQVGGGDFSPFADEEAPSAYGGRGSSRASSHSAAFQRHNGGSEPTRGLDHGAVIYTDPQQRRPPHPSEPSRRPAASPPPSHREPSRVFSRASSDRHTASSKASSRASSRALSHTFSNTHMPSSASSPLDGTGAIPYAAYNETSATSVSSTRRPSRAPSQASDYSFNIRPSGLSSRHILQAPAKGPTSGSVQGPAATAGEAALIRAAIATSSQLSVPGNKQLPKSSQSGPSRVPSVVSVNEPDPTPRIPLNRPGSPYATSNQLASDSDLHYQKRPHGSKDGFPGAGIQERPQSYQGCQTSFRASNERSGRPLRFSDGRSNDVGMPFATTNDYLPIGGQAYLRRERGSRRASRNPSSSTTPKASNKETTAVGGSWRASSRESNTTAVPKRSNDKEPAIGSSRAPNRGSNSTTTRIPKGKEPASLSKAKGAADGSEPSSDESDIESISSWHSDGGRGLPKWGNRESVAWEMISGK